MAWRDLPPDVTDRVIADVDPLSRMALTVARSGASGATFKFLNKLSGCLMLFKQATSVSEHEALTVMLGDEKGGW